jgi:hypothetical protein
MQAERRSIAPFQIALAASYSVSSGAITGPRMESRRRSRSVVSAAAVVVSVAMSRR